MGKKRTVLISSECHGKASIMADHLDMSTKECVERCVLYMFDKMADVTNTVQYDEESDDYENIIRMDLLSAEAKRSWPFWLGDVKKVKAERERVESNSIIEEKS